MIFRKNSNIYPRRVSLCVAVDRPAEARKESEAEEDEDRDEESLPDQRNVIKLRGGRSHCTVLLNK